MLDKLTIKGFKSIQSLNGLELKPVNLYPEALEVLAELIHRCSTQTQFILATQSPALADFFEPEEVLTVNRIDGISVFERQNSLHLEKWLEAYSLGQLWRKNIIKGGINND